MKKLPKSIRCFGQDFDTNIVCHEAPSCARHYTLNSTSPKEEFAVISCMREPGAAICEQRIPLTLKPQK